MITIKTATIPGWQGGVGYLPVGKTPVKHRKPSNDVDQLLYQIMELYDFLRNYMKQKQEFTPEQVEQASRAISSAKRALTGD